MNHLTAIALAAALPAQAAETVRKSYDIAGGDAVNTLKRFADESGRLRPSGD